MLRYLASAALALAPLVAPAQAATDWFASLYTNEGVELRADERIFALYALLNSVGYDEAPITRRDPVPKREFTAVRTRIRTAGAGLDSQLRARIEAFFDTHPAPVPSYLAYAVRLQGAPKFAPGGGGAKDLAGFEALLSQVHDKLKLADVFEQVQDDHRTALKAYLKTVDAPLAAVRKLLKLKEDDEQLRTVIAVNLLDGAGRVESMWAGDEQVVVVGPGQKADLLGVTREFARLHVGPAVARKAASYKAESLPASRSAAEYAVDTAVRAAAIKAALPAQGQESEFEAQAKAGYGGVREMARVLEEFARSDRPLDAYLSENWPRVEASRKK